MKAVSALARVNKHIWYALGFAAMVCLRIWRLDADPPSYLSWSTGIYTDEGIYANDARSEVLFGHWAPGNFHGALASMPLYSVQLAAFKLFGPQLIVARSISVVFGLGTVVLLFVAMRRLFGERAAVASASLLGFGWGFTEYNRLALMETPVAFCLVAAFAAIAPALAERDVSDQVDARRLVLGAALFVLAVAFKPFAWLALPGFIAGLWRVGRREAGWFAGAVVVLFAAYWGIVERPWTHELARMNAYYVNTWYLPHSWVGFWGNIKRGLFTGDRDGVFLSLLGMTAGSLLLALRMSQPKKEVAPARLLIGLWAWVPFAVWLFMSYTPTRYFVMILPPLAALAGTGVVCSRRLVVALSLISVGIVVYGLRTLSYSVRDTSASLNRTMLPGTVIAGQFAPELCFGTKYQALYIQPGLANDDRPIEKNDADLVLVTRSEYWNSWWNRNYPGLLTSGFQGKPMRIEANLEVQAFPTHPPMN